MPAIIVAFIATVLPTLIVLWWISANPRSVAEIGQSVGSAFGQIGKGAGEGVITPLLEYTALGSILALAIALAYKGAGRATGLGLPEPPSPPGFAPAPQFGTSVGIQAGPVSGVAGTVPSPLLPAVAAEAARRQQTRGTQQRGRSRR